MTHKISTFVGIFALTALAAAPALATKYTTTEISLKDATFVTGGTPTSEASGDLTGYFFLKWDPSTGTPGPNPVSSNPFSFVAAPGLAQDNSTSLPGFDYNETDASIVLSGAGSNYDEITVTNPPGPLQPQDRRNVVYITFKYSLIDLVDGSIATDPIALQTAPFPMGSKEPSAGECEQPTSFTGSSFCSLTSRRFFGSGAAVVVPEPSTWAMLLIGFAGLGFAGLRRAAHAGWPA